MTRSSAPRQIRQELAVHIGAREGLGNSARFAFSAIVLRTIQPPFTNNGYCLFCFPFRQRSFQSYALFKGAFFVAIISYSTFFAKVIFVYIGHFDVSRPDSDLVVLLFRHGRPLPRLTFCPWLLYLFWFNFYVSNANLFISKQ